MTHPLFDLCNDEIYRINAYIHTIHSASGSYLIIAIYAFCFCSICSDDGLMAEFMTVSRVLLDSSNRQFALSRGDEVGRLGSIRVEISFVNLQFTHYYRTLLSPLSKVIDRIFQIFARL